MRTPPRCCRRPRQPRPSKRRHCRRRAPRASGRDRRCRGCGTMAARFLGAPTRRAAGGTCCSALGPAVARRWCGARAGLWSARAHLPVAQHAACLQFPPHLAAAVRARSDWCGAGGPRAPCSCAHRRDQAVPRLQGVRHLLRRQQPAAVGAVPGVRPGSAHVLRRAGAVAGAAGVRRRAALAGAWRRADGRMAGTGAARAARRRAPRDGLARTAGSITRTAGDCGSSSMAQGTTTRRAAAAGRGPREAAEDRAGGGAGGVGGWWTCVRRPCARCRDATRGATSVRGTRGTTRSRAAPRRTRRVLWMGTESSRETSRRC